jgi:hypothetical protein
VRKLAVVLDQYVAPNGGMRPSLAAIGVAACICAVNAAPAQAQFKNGNQTVLLDLPRVSQRAVVTQRIGLTDVTIVYHRPLVGGRKIFGDVVSYGRVWRAGANDNTTIEFSDPVTIDGHALAAGRYGLHMIPGEAEWTIAFSKNSTSWGSFSYDPKEDAVRLTVKPGKGPFTEALTYEFNDLKQDGATIALTWDTLVVRFAMGVDTRAITLASLRNQMRHLAGFKAETFFEAALYCVDNEFNYDEALKWIDKAIQMDDGFDNLDLKAQILERLGRRDEAAAMQAQALKKAVPEQMFSYGERLMREKGAATARTFFATVTTEHPEAWINWYGLAKAQSALGDRDGAKKTLEASAKYAVLPNHKAALKRLLDRLAAGQGIG